MKILTNYFLYGLLGIVFFSGFTACSNEFELNAPAKEIPIVYGVLSRSDIVHYIRVEKAFLDESTSALELAQQPNQLYYDDIVVEIVQERTNQAYTLQQVDGAADGLQRADGIFATTPNILYKINASTLQLEAEESYRLNVRRKNSEDLLTTATTPIVSDLRLNRPIPGRDKLPLRIAADKEFTIVWGADETAKFFDAKLYIHYEEWDPNDLNSVTPKTVVWTMAKNLAADGGPNKVEPEGIEFYRFLANTIPEDATVLRRLTTIDIAIDAGGEELFKYINVGQANTGITSSQVIPVYTNLSEGLGVFASRNRFLEEGFVIDSATKELLRNGELTKDLNFR